MQCKQLQHPTDTMRISQRYGLVLFLVAGWLLSADGTAVIGQQPTDRPKVELRQSSEAQLAKGEINFDDLKFDIEKDAPFDKSMWTDRLKKINGKKVKLRGYMLPASIYRESGIKQFVLVRDNQECCFGPGAALYDCVWVEMVGDADADFSVRPVTVEGKFILDAEKYRYPEGTAPDGQTHMAVFRIEAVAVK